MRENTAVLIGHNNFFGLNSEDLNQAIKDCIQKGITNFLSGGQGGFDRLAARQVFDLKKSYPHIKNILVIPYSSFKIFNTELFDEIVFPEKCQRTPYRAAIPKRNKYMVDNASVAICFVKYCGGAAVTYEYAEKKNLNIINLI